MVILGLLCILKFTSYFTIEFQSKENAKENESFISSLVAPLYSWDFVY